MPRHEITYKSAATGRAFDLSGAALFAGMPNSLRGDAWDYKLGYRGMTYSARFAGEVAVTVVALDLAEADGLRRACDADVSALAPGTFSCDGWSQRAYVTGVEAATVSGGAATVKLTVALLDGAWRRPTTYEFRPGAGAGQVGTSHGYDYGYGYGYSYSAEASREIEVDSVVPSEFRMIVYGPATRPAVTVAGNRYQVSTDVPDGGYMVVDSIEGTVTKVTRNGYKTNCLANASLGAGEGSGNYIFERVPAGTSTVGFDGSFGWDLTIYVEDGAVPWTSS